MAAQNDFDLVEISPTETDQNVVRLFTKLTQTLRVNVKLINLTIKSPE